VRHPRQLGGVETLTATYVPADNRFAPSSSNLDMEVNVK
jgi:hypothetical protein